MVFTLDSDGSFNVDFKYDVIRDYDGGFARREIIWAYETLGFIPKEGTSTKVLLDEYLN